MKKKIVITIVIILTFFLGAGADYLLVSYYPLSTRTINKVEKEVKIEETAMEDAINKEFDTVVYIESSKSGTAIASGSGFVYKKDDKIGYILTNNHVVSSGNKIEVTFTSGEKVTATLLGSDELADLAVLSVPADKVIKVSEIGSSKNLELGNTVLTIGSPLGTDYSGTVTKGIVSGKDRLVPISVGNSSSDDWLMSVIQTDAAISPGNSGGPLINLDGQVVGINSMKLVDTGVEGIGFAIPIEEAMSIIDKLEKGEKIVRPVLGVALIDLDEAYTLYYNDITVDKDVKTGVVIGEVSKDSAAEKAGLKKGDVILKMGDKTIKNKAELRYELYKYDIGSTIKITYYRDKATKEVTVTLTK